MCSELIYTSAPRGLGANTRGFCTVACTAGMSRQLRMALEQLCAYDFVFNLSEGRFSENPVNYMHTRLTVGGKIHSVLSRVAACGADFSGRSNKIAHHVLLSPQEMSPEGPAWMLQQLERSKVFVDQWPHEPRELPERSLSAQAVAVRPVRAASHWQSATEDAGWAAHLPLALTRSASVPSWIVYQPPLDVLSLFDESMALLESGKRWSVNLATYYCGMVPSMVHWRGVVRGTPAAPDMKKFPQATVIDLASSLGSAGDDPLAVDARTGRPAGSTAAAQMMARTGRSRATAGSAAAASGQRAADQHWQRAAVDIDSQAATHAAAGNSDKRRQLVLGAIAAAAVLALIIGLGFYSRHLDKTLPLLAPDDVADKTAKPLPATEEAGRLAGQALPEAPPEDTPGGITENASDTGPDTGTESVQTDQPEAELTSVALPADPQEAAGGGSADNGQPPAAPPVAQPMSLSVIEFDHVSIKSFKPAERKESELVFRFGAAKPLSILQFPARLRDMYELTENTIDGATTWVVKASKGGGGGFNRPDVEVLRFQVMQEGSNYYMVCERLTTDPDYTPWLDYLVVNVLTEPGGIVQTCRMKPAASPAIKLTTGFKPDGTALGTETKPLGVDPAVTRALRWQLEGQAMQSAAIPLNVADGLDLRIAGATLELDMAGLATARERIVDQKWMMDAKHLLRQYATESERVEAEIAGLKQRQGALLRELKWTKRQEQRERHDMLSAELANCTKSIQNQERVLADIKQKRVGISNRITQHASALDQRLDPVDKQLKTTRVHIFDSWDNLLYEISFDFKRLDLTEFFKGE